MVEMEKVIHLLDLEELEVAAGGAGANGTRWSRIHDCWQLVEHGLSSSITGSAVTRAGGGGGGAETIISVEELQLEVQVALEVEVLQVTMEVQTVALETTNSGRRWWRNCSLVEMVERQVELVVLDWLSYKLCQILMQPFHSRRRINFFNYDRWFRHNCHNIH